jgi:hypothetical protein
VDDFLKRASSTSFLGLFEASKFQVRASGEGKEIILLMRGRV